VEAQKHKFRTDHLRRVGQKLDKQWREDTFVQRYRLPVIRAEVNLHHRQSSKAIASLDSDARLEFANPRPLFIAPIYPGLCL